MIFRITFFAVLLFTVSCSSKNNFPTRLSEKVDLNAVELTSDLPIRTSASSSRIVEIEELVRFRNQYQEKDILFDLAKFKKIWLENYHKIDINSTKNSDLQEWFEVTGLLLELTGETGFAEDLEKLAFSGKIKTDQVETYVFTKNLDNLFVNIFTPSIIEYKHTTGGDVKIEMQTDYPKSGKINMNFNMTERRYMEVNIRIPDWAEGATVTVKRVKYFAAPGSYCKIAKKWKEGDLVEIEFPIEKQIR